MQIEEPNWHKFRPGYGGPRRSYLHVSINRRGKMQLNTCLMETLDYPEAVALYYDPARSLIGIKPAKRSDEDALPVSLRETRRYGEVYALSFLHYYDIKITNTIATNYVETDTNGMLIVDLGKTREIYRKKNEDCRQAECGVPSA